MKDCLRIRNLDVRQARRMVQDRSELGGCEGECMGSSPGDKPLTLMRCHYCGLPQLYETFEWKSVCGRSYNLKGYKEEIFFLKLCFSCTIAHFMA